MNATRSKGARALLLSLCGAFALAAIAACNPGGVEGTTTTPGCTTANCGVAWTEVTGYISSGSGQPVSGATVVVHIGPTRHPEYYQVNQTQTDASGDFIVDVVRTNALPSTPPLDTLTMTVVGSISAVSGSASTDSTTFIAEFGPTSQTAPSKQIVLHLNP